MKCTERKRVNSRLLLLIGLIAAVLLFVPTAAGDQNGGEPATLRGQAWDDDANDAVEDAEIWIFYLKAFDAEGEGNPEDAEAEEGYIEVELPAGHYIIISEAPGYYDYFEEIELTEGEETYMQFDMEAHPETKETVSGMVKGPGGSGLKDAMVSIFNPASDFYNYTMTDNEGNFTIDFQPGNFTMTVDRNNYEMTTLMVDTTNATDLEINLTKPVLNKVSGFVFEDAGHTKPLGNAHVMLYNKDTMYLNDTDMYYFEDTTSSGGRAELDVPDGTYWMIIDKDGYQSYLDASFVVSGSTNFGWKDLEGTEIEMADVTVDWNADWEADVMVESSWNEDVATKEFDMDRVLFMLFSEYGYAQGLDRDDLLDGNLNGAEENYYETLLGYKGLPDAYDDMIEFKNSTDEEFPTYVDSLAVNILLGSDEIEYDFDIMPDEPVVAEDHYLYIGLELMLTDDTNYTYDFDLPNGWYFIEVDDEEEYDLTGERGDMDFAMDPHDGSGITPATVTVSDDAEDPMAHIAVDVDGETINVSLEINEGEEVTFNGSYSTDDSGVITEYRWNFTDYTSDNNWKNGTDEIVEHKFKVPGVYMPTLQVVDVAMNVSTYATFTITVNDTTKPTVTGDFEESVDMMTEVNFSFMIGDEEEVDGTYSITWNFSTNETITDTITAMAGMTYFNYTMNFTEVGDISFDFNVSDDSGNWRKITEVITVVDTMDPVAMFNISVDGDEELAENVEIIFNGTLSTDNDRIKEWKWYFSDGDKDEKKGDDQLSEDNSVVIHVFDKPGEFWANLTVLDVFDNMAYYNTTFTLVDTMNPKADFVGLVGQDSGWEETFRVYEQNQTIHFNASKSEDSSGDIRFYNWSFEYDADDEMNNTWMNGTEHNVSHVYDRPGSYDVKLVVWDNSNHSDEQIYSVSVLAGPKPELTIAFLNLSEKRLEEDEKVKVTCVINNIGNKNLTATTVSVYFYVDNTDGEPFKIRTFDTLVEGESTEISFTWNNAPRGSHKLIAVVDPEVNTADNITGTVDEVNSQGKGEGNNDEEVPFVVEKKAEDSYALYLAIGGVVVFLVFVILLRRKQQSMEAEKKLMRKSKRK